MRVGHVFGGELVRRIAEAATKPREQVLREVGDYVEYLVAALDGK